MPVVDEIADYAVRKREIDHAFAEVAPAENRAFVSVLVHTLTAVGTGQAAAVPAVGQRYGKPDVLARNTPAVVKVLQKSMLVYAENVA